MTCRYRLGHLFVVILFLTVLAGCQPSASNKAQVQQPADNGPLGGVLADLKAKATQDQYVQISTSIAEAPELASELSDLVASGRLTGIDVGITKKMGLFGAYTDNAHLVFTADYLALIGQTPPFDVRPSDAILPDQLAFVMGHLARHLKTPGPMPFSFSTPTAFAQAKLADEAAADIQGWNDVVNAAQTANAGKPLSAAQIGFLINSLRYRVLFVRAVQSGEKPVFAPSGRLDPTDTNIASLADALSQMGLWDIE